MLTKVYSLPIGWETKNQNCVRKEPVYVEYLPITSLQRLLTFEAERLGFDHEAGRRIDPPVLHTWIADPVNFPEVTHRIAIKAFIV